MLLYTINPNDSNKMTKSPNRINKNFVWGLDIKYEN